jgi:hypothetical protein
MWRGGEGRGGNISYFNFKYIDIIVLVFILKSLPSPSYHLNQTDP